jgi:7-keto-8-aminopelargonate synthetase-like enzyme
VSCSRKLKDGLKVVAPPYLYSGPSPVASLATTLMGLKVNAERGDEIRADLFRKTKRVLDQVGSLGIATPNNSVFPIIEIPLANPEDIDDVGRYLFDRGVYVTLAAYPLVPRNEVGFRVQLTAANTDEQIDLLNDVLAELCDRFSIHAQPEQHAVNG